MSVAFCCLTYSHPRYWVRVRLPIVATVAVAGPPIDREDQ